uniref:Uncharacterized protein n=1 Tax=Arundo donax TaxID=35708 RepID=A0A0A8Z4E9_ARUDO
MGQITHCYATKCITKYYIKVTKSRNLQVV